MSDKTPADVAAYVEYLLRALHRGARVSATSDPKGKNDKVFLYVSYHALVPAAEFLDDNGEWIKTEAALDLVDKLIPVKWVEAEVEKVVGS